MKRLLALLALLGLPAALPAQGLLEQVRSEVNTPAKPSGRHDKNGKEGKSGEDDSWGDLYGPIVGAVLLAPFAVPHILLHDELDVEGYFRPYPYSGDGPGYLWMLREGSALSPDAKAQFDEMHLGGWAGQLWLENGNDFRGLNRTGGTLVLDTWTRVGLRTSWNYFLERLPCGCWDDMLVGDVNLTFRFAQHECVSMYFGVGGRILTDAYTTKGGFNFTYGADVFPVRPVVVSALLDAGTLGSAGVFHARGTVGYCFERWEAFAGYDFLRIGSVNLQGPLVGLRLWF
jgi:hypothetical protein